LGLEVADDAFLAETAEPNRIYLIQEKGKRERADKKPAGIPAGFSFCFKIVKRIR
jgi:hypothetical protein